MLAEVGLRSGLDAIRLIAVVDLVQIQAKDLVLAILARDLKGQDGLAQLALERDRGTLFRRQQHIAHQLLGDRRRAAHHRLRLVVLEHGPQDAAQIDAGVLVEVGIFNCDRGIAQGLGHARQIDDGAAAALRVDQLIQQCLAIARKQLGCLGRAVLADAGLEALELAPVVVVHAQHGQHRQLDRQQCQLHKRKQQPAQEAQYSQGRRRAARIGLECSETCHSTISIACSFRER